MNFDKINNTLIELIYIPRRVCQDPAVSVHDFLKDAGYFEIRAQISEKNIYDVLVFHPDLVEDWLQYSEDKRSDHGWYFIKKSEGKYIVGYLSKESDMVFEYNDELKACSSFINRELGEVKKSE